MKKIATLMRPLIEALTELLDDIPQAVRVLLNDPPGFLCGRRLGPWLILIWFVGFVHGSTVRREPKRTMS